MKNTKHNPLSKEDKEHLVSHIRSATIIRLIVTDTKMHTVHVQILKEDAISFVVNDLQFECFDDVDRGFLYITFKMF
jgi:hypothetical protein